MALHRFYIVFEVLNSSKPFTMLQTVKTTIASGSIECGLCWDSNPVNARWRCCGPHKMCAFWCVREHGTHTRLREEGILRFRETVYVFCMFCIYVCLGRNYCEHLHFLIEYVFSLAKKSVNIIVPLCLLECVVCSNSFVCSLFFATCEIDSNFDYGEIILMCLMCFTLYIWTLWPRRRVVFCVYMNWKHAALNVIGFEVDVQSENISIEWECTLFCCL